MDALALLCTLHADGPATLKRLRARGYSSLVNLIERSATDLSADLNVEPAFARRLLREAKLLAVRVGAEGLEAEEAPPIASVPEVEEVLTGASSDAVTRPSIPIAAPPVSENASTLDEADMSLVERIVAAPKWESSTDAVPPELEPAAEHEPVLEPAAEPEPVVESVAEPSAEPIAEPEPCALEAASLPGLDADLIFDLKASGISTLAELAEADSLHLTRALGVTFAQARRLGFLARRASVADVPPTSKTSRRTTVRKAAPAQSRMESSVDSPAEARDAAPVERDEVVLPEVTLAPHRRPAPKADIARLSGGVGAPVAVPESKIPEEAAPEQEEAEAPGARKPFWEPREFLTESVEVEAAPEQGVKVDPSEIAPRPRFGDRLAQAAKDERTSSAEPTSTSGTILGWNFEIPRPKDEPSLPLGSLAVPEAEPEVASEAGTEAENASAAADQDRGGPFA